MHITINFKRSGKVVKTYPGYTLLQIARANKIPILSPCGGNALCGGCRVKVLEGNDIMDVSAEEYNRLSDEQIGDDWRLSCSFIPHGDIVVDA
ncbi:2Fe-2S iron-sulfur cluster binding domain-containing protein [Clostridium sp. D2Q-11]|uniref:2Fe-2S iron-sulfur cluster binding domain-containing protein n=1 Tax=Anaeromonas frigoriresistens TaxID=2683708 RepID=A0A942UW13_9FIRM|nr:2Fe-2S iron-sulfur cluster binding domain-containing protein [Anaeromonas frigoriresistens]MBS4539100.1 2Fe-2S iron-sulfur cluster binding domain-containing protein [Anaeromonas frigoriresistens]